MPTFEEYAIALKARDVFQQMVRNEVQRILPAYEYATVVSWDRVARVCVVQYPEGGDPVPVGMGAIQPTFVGQTVKINGLTGDKFVDDVYGAAYYAGIEVPWTALALQNSWTTPVGFAGPPLEYRQIGDTTLEVRGTVARATAPTYPSVFATLPVGLWPIYYHWRLVVVSSGVAFVSFDNANGNISAWGAISGTTNTLIDLGLQRFSLLP